MYNEIWINYRIQLYIYANKLYYMNIIRFVYKNLYSFLYYTSLLVSYSDGGAVVELLKF